MLQVLFTLDYEIHGNGDGSPLELMVEPTDRMLRLFDEYGARLTIMADVAEILKFKEYKEKTGQDAYAYDLIVEQLQRAVRTGHDVQLHIHSSYFNARPGPAGWIQDWTEYNFAGLPYERMHSMVKTCKVFLEELLRPVNPAYSCIAFRAANWSVSPSRNVVRALVSNGIQIDSSVFKFGRRQGIVNFDYSHAYSHIEPWRVSEDDICLADPAGKLLEFPIYSEQRGLLAFATPQRVYRACLSRLHRVHYGSASAPCQKPAFRNLNPLSRRHAWKADFNQCTGRELIAALRRAGVASRRHSDALAFVSIGHSKLFGRYNAWSLKPFLSFVAERGSQFEFGSFGKLPRRFLSRD